jgi:twitching motility protein PilI
MSDAMNDALAMPALLTPVEALRQEFEFDNVSEMGAATVANVYASHALGEDENSSSASELMPREGFLIGHLGLMIRYQDGSELADLPATYRLPNTPGWFLGVANLHGLLIPVFDLGLYLGVPHQEGAKPMLLVLGHGADAAGVVIDGLPIRLRVHPAERIQDAPTPEPLRGCISQTYWSQDRTWMDLQVESLLNRLNDELAGNPD